MFNQQPNGQSSGIQSMLSWWGFLVQVGAVSMEVFLHKRIGYRYCRFQGFMMIPLGVAYAWLWKSQGYDERPFMMFLAAFVFAVVMAQVGAIRRSRRGDHDHTQYSGWPVMLRQSAAHKEMRFKQLVEPLVVLMIGLLVEGENKPLGVYLIFAAACMFISNSLSRLAQKRRVDDMRDAVFAQQHTASQFRGT